VIKRRKRESEGREWGGRERAPRSLSKKGIEERREIDMAAWIFQ
jgi:hypothetical protein